MFRYIQTTSMVAGAMLLFAGTAQAVTVNAFSNGGFETAGAGDLAASWAAAGGSGYSQVCGGIFHTGNCAADITSPPLSSGVALQNNVLDGGQSTLLIDNEDGNILTMSFWTYGWTGDTGAANYALRLLDSSGNILATSAGNFAGSLTPTFENPALQTAQWVQVTDTITVPVGDPDGAGPQGPATAAFLEFSHGMGPINVPFPDCGLGHPNGLCQNPGLVYIDDVDLQVNAIPVPAAVWLFGSGLVGLVGVARRRKAS